MNPLLTMTLKRSKTMDAVNRTFLVARMRRLVTTTQAPRRTMVRASKMTSAVFAVAMALRTAHAIATEMHWMNAAFAAVKEFRMAHAIAMETYWTNAVFSSGALDGWNCGR